MREIVQKARAERIIYGCDFCKRTNVKKVTMKRHEKMCYHNLDRVCEFCDGSGVAYYATQVDPEELCLACERAEEVKKWLKDTTNKKD
jgi:hypothetical protein